MLGASAEVAGNDVCEFAKIVSGKLSGVTLNYDYKGSGTVSSNIAALKKEKGGQRPHHRAPRVDRRHDVLLHRHVL